MPPPRPFEYRGLQDDSLEPSLEPSLNVIDNITVWLFRDRCGPFLSNVWVYRQALQVDTLFNYRPHLAVVGELAKDSDRGDHDVIIESRENM